VEPELFSVAGENQFASLFSERWQSDVDEEKPVFVDYSPQVFVPLIEFLRLLRDSKPELPVPVVVDAAYRTAWVRMMLVAAFHPEVLRKACVTAQELHDSGCDAQYMREAGFSAKELLGAGYTRAELQVAGFQVSLVRNDSNRAVVHTLDRSLWDLL
jgi:hypothetical protein